MFYHYSSVLFGNAAWIYLASPTCSSLFRSCSAVPTLAVDEHSAIDSAKEAKNAKYFQVGIRGILRDGINLSSNNDI